MKKNRLHCRKRNTWTKTVKR